MKLKVAVVVGQENAGKSWTLKAFTCGLLGDRFIQNAAIRPVVIDAKDDLSLYGFQSKIKHMIDSPDWGIDWRLSSGMVSIDWHGLLTGYQNNGKAKDIVMSCEYKGKKVLVVSEGDYCWSWLVGLKRIQSEFKELSEQDEILLFCASKIQPKERSYVKSRGVELSTPGNKISFVSGQIELLQLAYEKTSVHNFQSELEVLRKLNSLFDEWTGRKHQTSYRDRIFKWLYGKVSRITKCLKFPCVI